MPLVKSPSKNAFRANVKAEVASGKPVKQAVAIAYIQIKLADGKVRWGAAVDTNIELASIKAVLSALNRV